VDLKLLHLLLEQEQYNLIRNYYGTLRIFK